MRSNNSLHWLLGLPFDCIGVEDARRRILDAIATRTKLVFATPNVNFLAESHRDVRFRECIWATQMSVADGMPLVWLGRLLGVPFPERVAGSTLMEHLLTQNNAPRIRVFFFGGQPGVAKAACDALNRRGGGLIAAGWYDPGFVSIEDMSAPGILASINAAKPDMVIVALGARKGHMWIERNRDLLEAPVISHLGATVGFISGQLRRAPAIFQTTGFEWLWRSVMEPRLAKRYATDALFLLTVATKRVVPLMLYRLRNRSRVRSALELQIVSEDASAVSLAIEGVLTWRTLPVLTSRLAVIPPEKRVTIDISGLRGLDSRSTGFLYGLVRRQPPGLVSVVCPAGSRIARYLHLHHAGALMSTREPEAPHLAP